MNPTRQQDLGTPASKAKVTAVQIAPAVHRSKWQEQLEEREKEQTRILETS